MTIYSRHSDFHPPIFQHHKTVWKGLPPRRVALFRLTEDYVYVFKMRGSWWRLKVPAGFTTDKSSVPDFGLLIGFPKDAEVEAAGLVHDFIWSLMKKRGYVGDGYLYIYGGDDEIPPYECDDWEQIWKFRITEEESNQLYEEIAEAGGQDPVRAEVSRLAIWLWPPNWFNGF